jgi:CRISPR/Cas system-associated endonuclease Cas1
VDALVDLALWNIDTYIMTRRNRVVALLKNVEDDSHVETRVSQYQAVVDEKKCVEIAKQFVAAKIKGEISVLKKYKLDYTKNAPYLVEVEKLEFTNLKQTRQKLTGIEGRSAQEYFAKIFKLFPEKIRPTTSARALIEPMMD